MQQNISRYHLTKKQALAYVFDGKVIPQMKNSLGDLIQRQMKIVGIKSNSELARLIGKSSAYVGDLINNTAKTKSGTYTPSQDVVAKLAKELQIPETEILEAMNYLPKSGENTGWYKGLDKLPPEKQKIAKRQIRAIIDALAEEEFTDEDFNYIDG